MERNSELSDKQKWLRFKSGDEFALSVIYSENARLLYQYGLKFTSNHVLIEDSIHDLFSDLIRNRKTIGNTDHIQFYLLKAFRRKLTRQMNYESRFAEEPNPDLPFDIKYSVEQDFIADEDQQRVSKQLSDAIEKLSPRQKEAIYLKFTRGLNYNEISQTLNMGVEASRNLVYRAIKTLKSSIDEARQNTVFFFILRRLRFQS